MCFMSEIVFLIYISHIAIAYTMLHTLNAALIYHSQFIELL